MAKKKNEENIEEGTTTEATDNEEPTAVEAVLNTVTNAASTIAGAVADGASAVASAVTGDNSTGSPKTGKRSERIGVVSSDKMMKTVVVRVDRLVKHPIYRKYVKRRKKFMAHDELGAKTGDKVRIIETRPTSARKRWRVVEIIQKAEL